jgi:hypothetical protein
MITDSVEDIRRKLSSTYVKYTPKEDEDGGEKNDLEF